MLCTLGATQTHVSEVGPASGRSNDASLALIADYLGSLTSQIKRAIDILVPDEMKKLYLPSKGKLLLDRLKRASKVKSVVSASDSDSSTDDEVKSEPVVTATAPPKPASSQTSPAPRHFSNMLAAVPVVPAVPVPGPVEANANLQPDRLTLELRERKEEKRVEEREGKREEKSEEQCEEKDEKKDEDGEESEAEPPKRRRKASGAKSGRGRKRKHAK